MDLRSIADWDVEESCSLKMELVKSRHGRRNDNIKACCAQKIYYALAITVNEVEKNGTKSNRNVTGGFLTERT